MEQGSATRSIRQPERDLHKLDPAFRLKVVLFLYKTKKQGYNIFVTETWRSQERQEYLYSIGRDLPGKKVTNTLESMHTKGLAIDIAFRGQDPYPDNDQLWEDIGAIAKKYGMDRGQDLWGADKVHFQDNPDFLPFGTDTMSFFKRIYEQEIKPNLSSQPLFQDPELAIDVITNSENPYEELVYLMAVLVGKVDMKITDKDEEDR